MVFNKFGAALSEKVFLGACVNSKGSVFETMQPDHGFHCPSVGPLVTIGIIKIKIEITQDDSAYIRTHLSCLPLSMTRK